MRRLLRYLGYLVGLIVVALLVLWFIVIPRWARPHAREDVTLSADERAAADARLAAKGLKLPLGGLYLEHPFAPSWSSRSLLVPDSWRLPGMRAFLGRRSKVRADLLRADLDVLEPVMQRAYGGWSTAEQRGWKWHDWFQKWRGSLEAEGKKELPLDDAFAPMDALLQVQLDNHTQIPLERMNTASASQTAVLSSAPQGACTELKTSLGTFALDLNDPAQRTRSAVLASKDGTLRPVTALESPSRRGELQSVHCGGEWIPLEMLSTPTASLLTEVAREVLGLHKNDRPSMKRLSDGIVYARVPDMGPSLYQHVEQDRPSWPTPTGHDRALIVDLRGNGGGDASFGQSVLRDWIDLKRLPDYDQFGMWIGESCLYAPLKWGFTQMFLGGAKSADAVAAEQELVDLIAKPYPDGCPREEKVIPAKVKYAEHHVQRTNGMRIIALVDNGCGSDCELLTAELATLPETIVVGVNTVGVAQFTQPGYAMLPHTGLPFRMALGHSDVYGDGRSVDGYGLNADVLIAHPDAWKDEELVRLTRSLIDKM